MTTVNALSSAGLSDPGLRRSVNEDRFHHDAARGIFIVVDGVGGQAAGGKAADIAVTMLRARLEREAGSASNRLRAAITDANNEICRLAGTRPEWEGMACVLTAVIAENGRATIGHVGDTRLYKLRRGRIEKVTRDHSPVGEREDAHEISEVQAMRHPRRNEVYRDVGSELHEPSDRGFIDIQEISFESDAALLLCSDGLTDLVPSTSLADSVREHAGAPDAVVRALIDKANAAGGKDNVTAVYVEGEAFAASQEADEASGSHSQAEAGVNASGRNRRVAVLLMALLLVVGFRLGLYFAPDYFALLGEREGGAALASAVVRPSESIAAAMDRAAPGATVIVEPGEYRERIVLKDGVRLVSRQPRGATIRLPATSAEADPGPAVIAAGADSELRGFRIVGDAATPLTVGLAITGRNVSIVDVEISGATKTGMEFAEGSSSLLLGSEIHDNPGAAIFVRSRANLRAVNNVFSRNGMSERASGSLMVEGGSAMAFHGNVFAGLSADSFVTLDDAARLSLRRSNWFLPLLPHGDRLNAAAPEGAARQGTR